MSESPAERGTRTAEPGDPARPVGQEPVRGAVGVLEVLADRQQHVRRDLQHQHPALRVDTDEDGDDQLLLPAAHADAQEVPPLLAALFDGPRPVLLELGRPVRRLLTAQQPFDGQEHALVDLQPPQPVPYAGARVLGRRPQLLDQGPDPVEDRPVAERLLVRVLVGPQFDGEHPGVVRLAGPAERAGLVVHDERGVLLQPDALRQPPEPGPVGLLGGVAGRVGEPRRGQLGGDDPGELGAARRDAQADHHEHADSEPPLPGLRASGELVGDRPHRSSSPDELYDDEEYEELPSSLPNATENTVKSANAVMTRPTQRARNAVSERYHGDGRHGPAAGARRPAAGWATRSTGAGCR